MRCPLVWNLRLILTYHNLGILPHHSPCPYYFHYYLLYSYSYQYIHHHDHYYFSYNYSSTSFPNTLQPLYNLLYSINHIAALQYRYDLHPRTNLANSDCPWECLALLFGHWYPIPNKIPYTLYSTLKYSQCTCAHLLHQIFTRESYSLF